jgi:hypothetical protein
MPILINVPDAPRVCVLHCAADAALPLRVLLAALLHRAHDHHDLSLRENGIQDQKGGHVRKEHGRARREQAGTVEESHTQDVR